ncbi:MAG TPA: ABC transporter permease subunit [Gemmatimonadaceae bacterium]|nr:ABC transporter permease subunit [Gemmatimonadaceae bacterium]
MSGFSAFLAKELQEIRKTWRIWVVPGMVLFFAVSSPIIAYLTPRLIASMAESQPGVTVILPPPTWTDAYGQFLKNLQQVVLIAVVITGAGAISGERAAGTAVLTLTKPLARGAFVLAKIISQSLLLIACAALGAAVCAVVTRVIFGPAPISPLLNAVLLWLAYALLLVTVMTFFSAWFAARGAAAGLGLAFFFVSLLIGIWAPAVRYTFIGLLPAVAKAIAGQPVTTLWPLATAVAMIVVSAAAAVKVFERQEL